MRRQERASGVGAFPRKIPNKLTAAEWHVMKIVWEQGDCAVRDVYQVAGDEHGWVPSKGGLVHAILRKSRPQSQQRSCPPKG